jgi:hypothetical protein
VRRLLIAALATAVLGATAANAAAVPVVTYSCTPAPDDCSGWYREPVRIEWSVPPAPATHSGCATDVVDFDTTGQLESCVVTDGSTVRWDVTLRVDMTPPSAKAIVSRAADANGWYRAPLQVSFSGTDATSGVASCTDAAYGGPDTATAMITGTCRDNAGNVSAPARFAFRYDATPPALRALKATPGDDLVKLAWTVPADAVAVAVMRSPGTKGAAATVVHKGDGSSLTDHAVRNGRRYVYTLRALDAAGNLASTTAKATPGRRLLSPPRKAIVGGPPTLTWTPIRDARYYNVQLFRHGRKVLSAWPRRPRLALEESWRFAGRRHHLRDGSYRWYVWPGEGPRKDNDYGPLVGKRTFVVRR